jgi:hypothetical protein
MSVWTFLVGLAVCVALAACSDGSERATPPLNHVADAQTGYAADIPPGWHTRFQTLGQLNSFTAEFEPGLIDDEDRAGCAGSDLTFVHLAIIDGDKPPRADDAVPRPQHFSARSGTGLIPDDPSQCGTRDQFIGFTDQGRSLWAFIAFGRNASPDRIDQAYAILESLHVTEPSSR